MKIDELVRKSKQPFFFIIIILFFSLSGFAQGEEKNGSLFCLFSREIQLYRRFLYEHMCVQKKDALNNQGNLSPPFFSSSLLNVRLDSKC